LHRDEGYLLSISKPGETITQKYNFTGSLGAFRQIAGSTTQFRSYRFVNRIVPLQERVIQRGGTTFTWRVNAYDGLARPTSITKASVLAP
jgi:hypothetical protein